MEYSSDNRSMIIMQVGDYFRVTLQKEEIIVEIKDLLQQTVLAIEGVTDLFYKQKEKEGYQDLNKTIGLISNSMDQLIGSIGDNEVPEQCQEIIKHLEDALRAMEVRDTILLADILQYELKEKFETLIDQME